VAALVVAVASTDGILLLAHGGSAMWNFTTWVLEQARTAPTSPR
jgi:hypothetical protein